MTICTQQDADLIGNALVLQDPRLTDWERNFICSLMDSRRLDSIDKLTKRQQSSVARIARKFVRGIAGWTAPTIYVPWPTKSGQDLS